MFRQIRTPSTPSTILAARGHPGHDDDFALQVLEHIDQENGDCSTAYAITVVQHRTNRT